VKLSEDRARTSEGEVREGGGCEVLGSGLGIAELEVMASRKGGSEGNSSGGSSAGKVGRQRSDGRQSKLVTEGRSGEKRVTFKG